MLKHLFVGLVVVFLTGCAHQKIHYVKTGKRPIVLNSDGETKSSIPSTHTDDQGREEIAAIESKEIAFTSNAVDAATSESALNEKFECRIAEQPQDSIRAIDASQKVAIALQAERDAEKAKESFIAAMIMFFIPIVGFFAIVPFVIGWVRLYNSNNARFITPEGERAARVANVLRYILLVLIGITTIALLTALFFLIF